MSSTVVQPCAIAYECYSFILTKMHVVFKRKCCLFPFALVMWLMPKPRHLPQPLPSSRTMSLPLVAFSILDSGT